MSTAPLDPHACARVILSCLDLTSLNDDDGPAQIDALCEAALSLPWGRPAAVCVWPALAARARQCLPPDVAVAAVANFPAGACDIEAARRDVELIVQSGAQEVDVVLPWRTLLAHDVPACRALLDAVRRASGPLRLKVILESGSLPDPESLRQACALALDSGADFLKTSTGKAGTGATPQAAQIMLSAIDSHTQAHALAVGFKASGGIRTVSDAALYVELVRQHFGDSGLSPQRLRFGASALLQDLKRVLLGNTEPTVNEPPCAY